MDEATERKVRDLKLKILKTEKELAATQHTMNLGAWLKAGHAGQIHRTAEKDRLRLEAKLAELKAKLEVVAPGSSAPKEKPKRAAKQTTPEEKPAPATKRAAAKKTAAKKPARKPARK
jgi:hypothetical protein